MGIYIAKTEGVRVRQRRMGSMIGQQGMTRRPNGPWSMGGLEARMDGVKRKRDKWEKGGIKQRNLNSGLT